MNNLPVPNYGPKKSDWLNRPPPLKSYWLKPRWPKTLLVGIRTNSEPSLSRKIDFLGEMFFWPCGHTINQANNFSLQDSSLREREQHHTRTWRTFKFLNNDMAVRRCTCTLWSSCTKLFRWYIFTMDWSSRFYWMATMVSRSHSVWFLIMGNDKRSCLCSKTSWSQSSKNTCT